MPRAAKVCSRPGCPEQATFRGLCAVHASEQRRARDSREHDSYRFKKASAKAKANATHCAECGERFTTDNPATGGHVRAVRHGGTAADGVVAQCAKCNYGWRRTGL